MITRFILFFTTISLIFMVSTDIVYIIDYFREVRPTYDKNTNTYNITKPYVELYLYRSFAWFVLFAVLIFQVCYLCSRVTDREEEPVRRTSTL